MADLLLFWWKTTENVFKSDAEIWPFCACAVQNTLCYPYLWQNVRNSRVIWKIGVEEHDGDVRFYTGSRNVDVSRMRSETFAIKRSFMAESPKFPYAIGNRGQGTRWWRQILNRNWKYGSFAHAQYKICYITLIYGGMSKILALNRKSGSRNMMMVTSDFRPEVEIWPTVAWKVFSTRIVRVFYFWKIRTYFYVLYFIIRVSSNSGPLDEQKLDC